MMKARCRDPRAELRKPTGSISVDLTRHARFPMRVLAGKHGDENAKNRREKPSFTTRDRLTSARPDDAEAVTNKWLVYELERRKYERRWIYRARKNS